jgi:hypothetical protein
MTIIRPVRLSVAAAMLAALVSTAPAAHAHDTRRDEEEEREAAESTDMVDQARRSGILRVGFERNQSIIAIDDYQRKFVEIGVSRSF